MAVVLKNTTEYAKQFFADIATGTPDASQSRFVQFSLADITITRLKQFIGLSINMDLFNKINAKDYWSTKYPSQHLPFFAKVMSYHLFSLLSTVLHVGQLNVSENGHSEFHISNNMRPILDALNAAFKHHFVPSQEVSIDQCTASLNNWTVFSQNKTHSFYGIRKLCCAKTGYVIHAELHSGKGLSREQLVVNLMQNSQLLNRGYHLFTDSTWTSLKLAPTLLNKGTMLTGVVCRNARGLPSDMPLRLNAGEVENYRRGNALLVSFQQKAREKPVLMLSSCLGAGMEQHKPKAIAEYNKFMGAVSHADRTTHRALMEQPSKKHSQKLFLHLVETALLNAYVLYSSNTDNNVLSRLDFIASVVESLCEESNTHQPCPLPPDRTSEPPPKKCRRMVSVLLPSLTVKLTRC